MARKSRVLEDRAISKNAAQWRAALYVRLSRDDGDKEESDSVQNQRTLLLYHLEREVDIEIYDVYIDDGFSGTNFERPGFTRMMEDIRAGHVNCVAVKDLSRFGRNYIDVGNYIEKVFPFLDVRFISISDNIDSYLSPHSMNNIVFPIRNIINDEYCRDISNKVRSSLDLKRRQGKFIGSFAAYGYLKDPNDRNKLVIDEDAAEVVRDIFAWFIGGMGALAIARRLNGLGVPNPSAYKRSLGFNYRHSSGGKNDGLWCDSSVRRILSNRLYIGTLEQGKNRVKSYKVQVSVAVPQKDWIQIENSHTPIVSVDIFNKAQGLLGRDTRTPPGGRELHLFSGFLRCADCGKAMNRKRITHSYGDYHYYICSTFKKMDKGACTKHTIRADKLEEAVLLTIRKQIQLAVSMDEMANMIRESGRTGSNTKRLIKALDEKERERSKYEGMKLALYPDWKNGDITREEYHALKEDIESKLQCIHGAIDSLQCEIDAARRGADTPNAFTSCFSRHNGIEKLTREILAELVEFIYVHEGSGITIKFKFADEYEKAVAFIQGNKGLVGS